MFSSTIGQQMTPDTAKIKCKNFLATLLRLASDQPEAVARNVRSLIQVCKIKASSKARVPSPLFGTSFLKLLGARRSTVWHIWLFKVDVEAKNYLILKHSLVWFPGDTNILPSHMFSKEFLGTSISTVAHIT